MGHGPLTSLSGVSSVGAGSTCDLTEVADSHTIVVAVSWTSITGGSPSVSVDLEGSHDGSNWVTLVNCGVSLSGAGGGSATNFASASGIVRYVRANFIQFSGSADVTGASITATIASQ